MHCDVAPGFNLKIGDFSHFNCVEREKVTLCCIKRFRVQWKRSGLLVFNDICEPIIQENVASLVCIETKKAICRSLNKRSQTMLMLHFSEMQLVRVPVILQGVR